VIANNRRCRRCSYIHTTDCWHHLLAPSAGIRRAASTLNTTIRQALFDPKIAQIAPGASNAWPFTGPPERLPTCQSGRPLPGLPQPLVIFDSGWQEAFPTRHPRCWVPRHHARAAAIYNHLARRPHMHSHHHPKSRETSSPDQHSTLQSLFPFRFLGLLCIEAFLPVFFGASVISVHG
jgi:hypothetical protein